MKYAQLFKDHAYWSAERKRLQKEGSEEMSRCKSLENYGLETCLQKIYREWGSGRPGHYDDYPSFEEDWDEAICVGTACQHCQNVRDLRERRMAAGRKLGGIRAAITRIGRRLAAESEP